GGHRVEDHGRLEPLELVDRAHGHVAQPGGLQRLAQPAHLRVVGRTTMKSDSVSGRVSPLRLVHEQPSIALISRATRSASSGAAATLPMCSTGKKRSPVPNAVAWVASSGRPASRPSYTTSDTNRLTSGCMRRGR